MRVYIGSAIDTALGPPEEQYKDLVDVVLSAFPGQSVVIFNPLTAYSNAHAASKLEDIEFVCKLNEKAVELADMAVFSWTKSPSFGVPLEIQEFARAKKPFVVWMREGSKSGLYLKRAVEWSGVFTSSKEETIKAVYEKGRLIGRN